MTELPALATFLRNRRERVSPASVGLRSNGRRRTPGLRREEVATLAGVSVDYLVRLEQGRDTNPSHEVLLALAEALQLNTDETGHLMALVSVGNSPRMEELCPSVPRVDATVPPSVQAMLDRMDPTPAHVVGPIGDVIGSNAAWRALVEPMGLADGANLVQHAFAHPEVYVDWAAVADARVARLRSAQLLLGDDQRLSAMVGELLELPEFAQRWNGHAPAEPGRGALRMRHPDAGVLEFTYESMTLAGDDQRLVCWLPADAVAESVLDHLDSEAPVSPARLRVVGDG